MSNVDERFFANFVSVQTLFLAEAVHPYAGLIQGDGPILPAAGVQERLQYWLKFFFRANRVAQRQRFPWTTR